MFVAVCDQNFGNSTPFWSKTGLVLAGDEGIAELPLHLVERVAARNREEAVDADGRGVVDDGVDHLAVVSAVTADAFEDAMFLPRIAAWSRPP